MLFAKIRHRAAIGAGDDGPVWYALYPVSSGGLGSVGRWGKDPTFRP
jgi:hypothetical protein